MKRRLILTLLAIGLSASLGGTAPQTPQPVLVLKLAPYTEQFLPMAFQGQQRAVVIASGTGATQLGLYIFDQHGNCIARDEAFHHASRDDLAVEWFPQESGAFVIEVRNAGARANDVQLAIR